VLTADRALVVTGLAIIVLGLSSKVVKTHGLSPIALALAAGALLGPHALDVVDLHEHAPRHVILEELARVTLALSVVDIALRLRPRDLRREAKALGSLLLVVMPGMWVVTGAGVWLLLGLPFAAAFVFAAALTPTDPGAASALATGRMPNRLLPRDVRMTLQGEAAANDGLALPFLLLAGAAATVPPGSVTEEFLAEAGRQEQCLRPVDLPAGPCS
jgi:sodium/hydrogen antiporter